MAKRRFHKDSQGTIRSLTKAPLASKKKLLSIASLLILGILLCSYLPLGVYASGNQIGITTSGTTNYPTATFGTKGDGTNTGGLPDILIATKYTLAVSGTVTQIGGYASGPGNWKFGIYSDNSGAPGTLLASNNVANPVVFGDNVFNIGPVYLTAGTYWLAILTDAGNRRYVAGSTNQAAYIMSYGFSNNLPSTFGAGAYQDNNYVAYATYVQIEGYAKATKVTLGDDNAAITSLSFYSHSTGNFRLAIYSDSSGPNTLLWQSADTAAIVGWNTVPITSGTPSSLTLSSGTYWLVWQWSSPNLGPSYTAGGAGSGNNVVMSYGTFPVTWSSGATSNEQWSIYATYTTTPMVTPEFSWGTLGAILLCFGAFALFVKYKKPKPI